MTRPDLLALDHLDDLTSCSSAISLPIEGTHENDLCFQPFLPSRSVVLRLLLQLISEEGIFVYSLFCLQAYSAYPAVRIEQSQKICYTFTIQYFEIKIYILEWYACQKKDNSIICSDYFRSVR